LARAAALHDRNPSKPPGDGNRDRHRESVKPLR
jgi:hypothetical protein